MEKKDNNNNNNKSSNNILYTNGKREKGYCRVYFFFSMLFFSLLFSSILALVSLSFRNSNAFTGLFQ
jgi:hypothetical protein